MKVKSESEVAQSCLTLSNPMDGSLPGSSVRGIFQARVLEWGAIAFSSCANRLKGWSKGHIRLLLPPSPLPPHSSLLSFSSSGSLLWALSHHPSSAFHSLTTPGNARTTIITFRLIPFLSPCPLKCSTFSSHRLIFLQHRFLSGPFPVQKCLLIQFLIPHLIMFKNLRVRIKNYKIQPFLAFG